MGRPKKSRLVGVHVSHGVVTRVDHAPAAAQGAHAAAAAAVAAAKLAQHSDPQDSEEEEEDEEAAEFRREATELLKNRQQQSALPRGLRQKELDGAISSLVSQTGISKQVAEDALLATAEQYHMQFDEWINEAMMWLAVQSEVQDEAAKLRVAMEVSLREREAALQAEEAAAPPLTNLNEERLRKKFADSVILHRLGAVLPGSVLFSDRAPFKDLVKIKLVDLLRIEANCNKWWPDRGTQQYFEDLAGKLCEEISQASSSRSSITAVAAAATAAAQPAAAGAPPVVATDPTLVNAVGSSAGSLAAALGAQRAAAQQGQQFQPAAGVLQHARGLSSSPPANPVLADGGCAAAAGTLVLPAAAAGITGGGAASAAGVSCGVSCGPDAAGPCSTAGTDSMAGDPQRDDGAATGVRASKRKRQPPARYNSPSPGPAADSHKRQQRASSDEQLPAKRLASLDCLAAGGPDSRARCSASPSPAHLQPSAGRAASTAASGQGQSALDSRQQQDRGTAGLQPPQQPQQLAAQAAALAACDSGGCSSDGLQAYLSASQCLSQLLDAELAVLRHHIYTMPDKAGAMPVIFQLPEDQQAEDGDDSDVEVVGMRQPTGGRDIPEPQSPASPALGNSQQPVSPPVAGAATAGQAVPAAAAHTSPATAAALARAHLQGADSVSGTAAAAAAAAAEAQAALLDFGWPGYAMLPAAAAAAGAHLYMPGQAGNGTAAGAAIPGQPGGDMYSPGAVQYRASTNESGDLVIEID